MIKPKSRMIEPTSEAAASEVFVISDNIIPIRVASVDAILNTEFTEEMEVVPESQVKTLIVQNKTTNPMSKFFVRVGTYLDSLESFLNELDANYIKSIEQKNEIVQNEKTEQFLRTYKAKKTAKKLSEEKKKNKKPLLDIGDPDALSMIALNMGLTIVKGIADIKNMILGPDVPYEAIKGKLIPYGPTGGAQVSGYPVSTNGTFGMRIHPIYGDYRLHGGVDVGVPSGTMFALKAKTKVVFAGVDTNSGYGNVVEVYVPDLNKMFRFAHLSSIAVKKGEELEPGSVLGKAGSTGLSTGVHFHIETHSDYVDGTDHPHYGHEDPAPSLGYVILGNDLQQKAEGSIERIGKVMVGEAGEEFVIPLSQMPIFAHLMMEEKIKCLIPEYQQRFNRFPDIGFERLAGTSNDVYGSGAIVKEERALLKTIAKAEGTTLSYGTIFGGKVIPELEKGELTVREVYDMMMEDVVRGRVAPYASGSRATGRYQFMPDTLSDIVAIGALKWDEKFTHEAQDRAILARLDNFRGVSEDRLVKEGLSDSVIHDLSWEFASFPAPDGFSRYTLFGRKQPAKPASKIRGWYLEILPTLVPPRPEPKPQPRPTPKTRPTNIKEALWDFGIVPGLRDAKKSWGEFIQQFAPKDRSSLNNIPGNEQMEIASEDQDQFSFDNAKGEIIALYKPTVYYSDPA